MTEFVSKTGPTIDGIQTGMIIDGDEWESIWIYPLVDRKKNTSLVIFNARHRYTIWANIPSNNYTQNEAQKMSDAFNLATRIAEEIRSDGKLPEWFK